MKPQRAHTHEPLYAGTGSPVRRLAQEIRFVAGIAIALGGAGVLLSDLAHYMPSLG